MLYNIEPFFPPLDLPEPPDLLDPPDLLVEELEDFELLDYECHPAIKFEISV